MHTGGARVALAGLAHEVDADGAHDDAEELEAQLGGIEGDRHRVGRAAPGRAKERDGNRIGRVVLDDADADEEQDEPDDGPDDAPGQVLWRGHH